MPFTFGPDLPDGRHLLIATNDNDFVVPFGAAGLGFPNYFFAIDSADLPGFVAESFSSSSVASFSSATSSSSEAESSSSATTAIIGAQGAAEVSLLTGSFEICVLIHGNTWTSLTVFNSMGSMIAKLNVNGAQSLSIPVPRSGVYLVQLRSQASTVVLPAVIMN